MIHPVAYNFFEKAGAAGDGFRFSVWVIRPNLAPPDPNSRAGAKLEQYSICVDASIVRKKTRPKSLGRVLLARFLHLTGLNYT